MRTFGGFRSGDRFFYGEIRGERSSRPKESLLDRHRTDSRDCPPNECGRRSSGRRVQLICSRPQLLRPHRGDEADTAGTPLIWFKSPGSLLPHDGTIEIAFPEHQTDFEAELAVVIGRSAKNVLPERALDFVFGYTIGLDISDRDLQKTEKQFGRCKSFDTYTPIGRLFIPTSM